MVNKGILILNKLLKMQDLPVKNETLKNEKTNINCTNYLFDL